MISAPSIIGEVLEKATTSQPFQHITLGFILGLLASLLAFTAIPAIWHCPTNPLLGQMVQLRKKRMRLSGGRSGSSGGSGSAGFGQFEMKDHYGLEHQVLNMDFEPETMWMNVGFWKNNPKSLPEACQALLEEVLNTARLSKHHKNEQRFSVLEVGCGCAEPARFLRREFADDLDVYVGVTLNGCQAAEAARRLDAQCGMGTGDNSKDHTVRYGGNNHIYRADAADPSSWPESLQNVLKHVSSQPDRDGTTSDNHTLWLLAIDTLYHFTPTRKHILTHAHQTLNASLMATDIIIPDNLSWVNRLKLRAVFFGLQVPWANIVTGDEYIAMLVECGYARENITLVDITEHCFAGFDEWTRTHMRMWEAMGGSRVITRAVRMMGAVMGWWAWEGVVREVIVVARRQATLAIHETPPMLEPPTTDLPKPAVPYTPGWQFTAKPHTPPSPTPVPFDQGCCTRNSEADLVERRELGLMERCLKHPPLPGLDECEGEYEGKGEDTDTVTLEIIDAIKVGDGHNSQKTPNSVAKLYDPLYFDDDCGYLNPFLCVDQDYTHESNAYMALAEFQGGFIPMYYGSHSVKLSVELDSGADVKDKTESKSVRTRAQTRARTRARTSRNVRMILIEYIPGIAMVDANPREYQQSVRQEIMKSIVNIESKVYEKDILLTDLEPRNVITQTRDEQLPDPE
ncbi:hypothetical protein BJY00DRAFT_309135 [Aspergillus carlsbadensis]|nr:hypothetical protein BJY00DRAFT_309135 [Aspergillus carlsbadensis]